MGICESCHAGCCRSFAIPLTGADIIRIERELKLPFWDFACRWADPNGAIARNYAPHLRFSDEPGTPFIIALMHEVSSIFVKTTKCRFLIECPPDEGRPLGQARCGIYKSRPMTCRAFPTKFDAAGELALIEDIPSHARDVTIPVYQLCPRPWEPSDVDPIEGLQDLAVARYEMNFFKSLASVWNRNPQPWSVFPEFLHRVYDRRVSHEPISHQVEMAPQILKFDQIWEQGRSRTKAA